MSSPSTPEIAIVIPNWNGASMIERCIDSLLAQTIRASVVVVDNGSVDESLTLLRDKYPQVIVLSQPQNLGFAGGVNIGIHHAIEHHFEFIALFNNDAVADTEWLYHLLSAFKDPSVGASTGLLLSSDGSTIDSSGEFYTTWGLPFSRQRDEPAASAHEDELVFGASGGATLYRSKLFLDIGYFDEHFFAYYEDADINFRAQLAGWEIAYTRLSIARHATGSTSGQIAGFTIYHMFKNLPLLFLKNTPRKLLISVGVRFYCAYLLILLKALTQHGRFSAVKGAMKSLTLFGYALRERRRIQNSARVNSDVIKRLLWPDLPPKQAGLRRLRGFFVRNPKPPFQ